MSNQRRNQQVNTYPVKELPLDTVAALDLDTRFKLKRGRTWYESAHHSRGRGSDLIRISRLVVGGTPEDGIHQVNRYVHDQPVIVELNEAATLQLEASSYGL